MSPPASDQDTPLCRVCGVETNLVCSHHPERWESFKAWDDLNTEAEEFVRVNANKPLRAPRPLKRRGPGGPARGV